MEDVMSLKTYLAEGGVLTSPENVPARYRAELMKLMATFVDSELAGAAGFADVINAGPGIKHRIAAAKIVLEKTDNADKVLQIMGQFGANTERYANHHPWTARLAREADIGASRVEHDMRLAVFNYPLQGWHDAVVMNLLMGLAVAVQLEELGKVSYQPLAEAFRQIAPVEQRHTELAQEGLAAPRQPEATAEINNAITYWWPRVAASFGKLSSEKFDHLKQLGLRHDDNAALRSRWEDNAATALQELGLDRPE